jgi:hypothetical protein
MNLQSMPCCDLTAPLHAVSSAEPSGPGNGGEDVQVPDADVDLNKVVLGHARRVSLGLSLRWDLPAGKMSRMAHGGFGLEVDPHVVMEESEQALSSVELDQADEVDWTQVWRLDQFLALGFDAVRASLMAEDARVDLAQARKLVALGCPLDTALRILL